MNVYMVTIPYWDWNYQQVFEIDLYFSKFPQKKHVCRKLEKKMEREGLSKDVGKMWYSCLQHVNKIQDWPIDKPDFKRHVSTFFIIETKDIRGSISILQIEVEENN